MNQNSVTYSERKQTWKGQTYQQIVAALKRNQTPTVPSPYIRNPVLKIYRKEIATNQGNTTTNRISIDDLNMPNGANRGQENEVLTRVPLCKLGVAMTVDYKDALYSHSVSQCPSNGSTDTCLAVSTNALNGSGQVVL